MWPYPKVLAHRGAGVLAPENTLAAMQFAWNQGFRAVEFDVMLSKDQLPVLIHDEEFGRTVAGNGLVAETLARDLLKLDAGSWHSQAFADARIPLLEQVVAYCRQHEIWMNVEIKPAQGFDAQTGQVVASYLQQAFSDVPVIEAARLPLLSSFSRSALLAAKQAAPNLPRAYLLENLHESWRSEAQELAVVAIHLNHRELQQDQVKMLKDAGYGVFCYTVNQLERARELLRWGVDGFCTDRLDLIPYDF